MNTDIPTQISSDDDSWNGDDDGDYDDDSW